MAGKVINTEIFYGIEITDQNKYLGLADLDGPYTINIKEGYYTPQCLMDELNGVVAALDKDVRFEFNRETCRVKIITESSLDLLTFSGIQPNMYEFLGFTQFAADIVGDLEYEGETGIGTRYRVQFCPQSLLRCEDNKQLKDATITESISGKYECFHCGEESFFEFNLRFITDIKQDCFFMFSNPNGVQDARDLFDYMICKRPIELMPDCDKRDEFYTVVLDQTPESRNGTGYELKEMYAQGLCGYYETGILRFKCIDKET